MALGLSTVTEYGFLTRFATAIGLSIFISATVRFSNVEALGRCRKLLERRNRTWPDRHCYGRAGRWFRALRLSKSRSKQVAFFGRVRVDSRLPLYLF